MIHCDLELAAEVWQCPLRSGAGEEAEEETAEAAAEAAGMAEAAGNASLIKSSNP